MNMYSHKQSRLVIEPHTACVSVRGFVSHSFLLRPSSTDVCADMCADMCACMHADVSEWVETMLEQRKTIISMQAYS